MMKNLRLGEVLVGAGYITEEQLNQALDLQKRSTERKFLGDLLIELGYITEMQMLQELAKQLQVEILPQNKLTSSAEVINLVPKELAEKFNLLPISIEGPDLYVATDNPLNYYAFQELSELTGKQIVPYIAKKEYVQIAIEQNYANKNIFRLANEASEMYDRNAGQDQSNESYQQMMERVDSSPVVKLVNTIITQGVTMQASDIHIEPKQNNVVVRFRIDGDLIEVMVLNIAIHLSLVTRLKIISNLDIAERRAPQDGRFNLEIGTREVSFRISTLPSIFGEKIVIRILGDNKVDLIPLPMLGMRKNDYDRFSRLIHNPNGVILVTGPTGSGKTTTIYSALAEVAKPSVNVVTVEDPVEKIMENITQVHINPKAGVTFANGLRSIMRQDPDVIMVGETRDKETALIVAQAAITGHLVLSTIHTNDAPSTFMRLIDMGAEPYIVASSVIGVVAQRLVKLICPACKEEYTPTEDELRYWDKSKIMPKFYRGAGCSKCNHTGYRGRSAVYEIIMVNQEIRDLIMQRASSQKIKEVALKHGFTDMKDNAMELIAQGKTTLEEMYKVINFLQ